MPIKPLFLAVDLKTAQFREHIRIYYFDHFGYSWSEHLCHIDYATLQFFDFRNDT